MQSVKVNIKAHVVNDEYKINPIKFYFCWFPTGPIP